MIGDSGDKALIELASGPQQDGSTAALWMLLLLRLTAVTADQRLELRNSAIQTLLRIIHAYGNRLGPEAWSICVKAVIFKLLFSIETRLQCVRDDGAKDDTKAEWNETAVVIIQGVSNLLASYMDVLTAYSAFTALWQDLIRHFATMLDFKSLDTNSATFSSLSNIVRKVEEGPKSSFDKDTIDLAWDLWSRGIPVAEQTEGGKFEDNQKCLISWVEALLDLYRLIRNDLTVEQVRRMLSLLRDAMQQATPGSYASDAEYVTPLQGRILEVFKLVRTDIPGVPSAMISQVADFVSLAFTQEKSTGSTKRTYLAMSKESMSILEYHILANASDTDIYASGAFSVALAALAKPITLKYDFPVVTKSTQPWKVATSVTLSVLEATLPQVKAAKPKLQQSIVQEIWDVVIAIAQGIISANYVKAAPGTNIPDDQDFDIASFRKLRELIIPSLGADIISDKTRRAYAEALFRTSIIHEPAPAEQVIVYGDNNSSENVGAGLDALYKPRNGRTIDPPPTKRVKMSYVCLEELFEIVSAHDESVAGPEIVLQPPTPKFPPPGTSMSHPDPLKVPVPDTTENSNRSNGTQLDETAHGLYVHLARTAAPFLILRCALSLRAFVADQPLRGRMPQPLSQRKELSRILRCLVDLKSEPKAIPDLARVTSENRKHLLRLLPLLVGAVGCGGDASITSLVKEALLIISGELDI